MMNSEQSSLILPAVSLTLETTFISISSLLTVDSCDQYEIEMLPLHQLSQVAQKDLRGKARDGLTSGGVLNVYDDARQLSWNRSI